MIGLSDQVTVNSLLHEWLVKQNGRISAAELDDDTPILERRVITSLQVLDLILFIESLRGGSIDVRLIKQGSFRSINTIVQHFFSEQRYG